MIKEITETQRNEIAEFWETDQKKYMKKLQRIYNSTVPMSEKDTDCLCTRSSRKIWLKWFQGWALENGYYDKERAR